MSTVEPSESASAGLVQGPLTLEQMAVPAGDTVFRTVPVPILVGPPSAALDATIGADSIRDGIGATADALPAAKAATAGGWFFSKPMAAIELLLTTVHDTTGLPWWATIAATTFSVRVCLLPLQIYQSKSVARMAIIRPQIDELGATMREASQKGTPKGLEDAEKARQALQKLFDRNHVRPWMTIVGAIGQLPLWISFFFTMRHLVREGAGLGLEQGGALWFPDLTQPDPYYLLPLGMGTSFFYMVSLGDPGQTPGAPVDPRQQQMKQMMKFSAFAMVPLTASFQSGVFLYWITTNATSITQTLLLRQPAVRQVVGLPPLVPVPVPVKSLAPPQAASGPLGPALAMLPEPVQAPLRSALGMSDPSDQASGALQMPSTPAPRERVTVNTDVSVAGSRPLESARMASESRRTIAKTKARTKRGRR